jgi:hypothetical protein
MWRNCSNLPTKKSFEVSLFLFLSSQIGKESLIISA